MTKQIARLALNRETLLRLDRDDMTGSRGGAGEGQISAKNTVCKNCYDKSCAEPCTQNHGQGIALQRRHRR